MADINHLHQLYDENLSGRGFNLHVKEISGNARRTYTIVFQPWNADHLIGEGSRWHEEKVQAFTRMCSSGTWKMVGDYMDSMGVKLSADILVGGTNQVFGFRQNDDGTYCPVTCLLVDIRDYTYEPRYKIESVDQFQL